MDYVLLEWNHDEDDEPYLIYSELDDARYEKRKIEFFRNGLTFSYGAERGHPEALGDAPFPTALCELERAGQPGEFIARKIPPSLFYEVWNQVQEQPDGFMGMFF